MSWSDGGEDQYGRYIGYSHSALCDHPNCFKRIDHGLAYVCGGMHGGGDHGCGRYFCAEHLYFTDKLDSDGNEIKCYLCSECMAALGDPVENAPTIIPKEQMLDKSYRYVQDQLYTLISLIRERNPEDGIFDEVQKRLESLYSK